MCKAIRVAHVLIQNETMTESKVRSYPYPALANVLAAALKPAYCVATNQRAVLSTPVSFQGV